MLVGTDVDVRKFFAIENFYRSRLFPALVAARGLEMTGVDLDTMEEVWQQVKRQETDL